MSRAALRRGNADDATAVNAERPLVRAGDEDVRAVAIEHHAPERLRDVHGDDRIRREPPHRVAERRPVDAVAVVEAHERDLHELACAH